MAERRPAVTDPVLDSKSEHDNNQKTLFVMPEFQFATAIRTAKRATFDTVSQLYETCTIELARLKGVRPRRIKPDLSKALSFPKKIGSDQVDVQSIVSWMSKLKPPMKHAIRQLVALHATLSQRM